MVFDTKLFIKKITAFIFGVIISFVILELFLQSWSMSYMLIQKFENYRALKKKNSYKILCLGESTTFRQYPKILQELLNENSTGLQCSVIDMGRPGTNSYSIVNDLEKNLDRFDPDMLIVMMGVNDHKEFLEYNADNFSSRFKTIKLLKTINRHLKAFISGKEHAKKSFEIPEMPEKDADIKQHAGEMINRAYDHFVSNELIEAEKAYLEAAYSYYNEEHLRKVFRFYVHSRQTDKISNYLKKILKRYPLREKDIKIVFAETYYDNSLESEGYGMLEDLHVLYPEDVLITLEFALKSYKMGKTTMAEKLFGEVLARKKTDPGVYYKIGALYSEYKDYTKSEDFLKRSISLDPENLQAINVLIYNYFALKDFASIQQHMEKKEKIFSSRINRVTYLNYNKLKNKVIKSKKVLVCMQYPMRNVSDLKKMFHSKDNVIFIENKNEFIEAIKNESYEDYFKDSFAGDFGHCTEKGNKLIAENIVKVLKNRVFKNLKP